MADQKRMHQDIETLRKISEPCAAGTQRPSYTPEYGGKSLWSSAGDRPGGSVHYLRLPSGFREMFRRVRRNRGGCLRSGGSTDDSGE